ncbi:MAG: hypothetical protein U9R75_01125 [Candidatus Thermoplasmatota archaeon]|nr:hypothetical protein [Candidatus Thermoplasmatota archaeon]
MVEEKQVMLPRSLVRNLFTLLMAAGIVLYASWTVVLVVKHGVFFDLGLYSICIIMVLFGLTGRMLFGGQAKTDSQ